MHAQRKYLACLIDMLGSTPNSALRSQPRSTASSVRRHSTAFKSACFCGFFAAVMSEVILSSANAAEAAILYLGGSSSRLRSFVVQQTSILYSIVLSSRSGGSARSAQLLPSVDSLASTALLYPMLTRCDIDITAATAAAAAAAAEAAERTNERTNAECSIDCPCSGAGHGYRPGALGYDGCDGWPLPLRGARKKETDTSALFGAYQALPPT